MRLNRLVETAAVPDLALWGKRAGLSEPYPLLCHLLDTAASAGVLWDRWLRRGLRDLLTSALAPGDPDLARRRMQAVAGLHDLGKASPWQGQVGAQRQPQWARAFRSQLEGVGYDFPVPHYWQVSRHEAVGLTSLHGAPIPGHLDPTCAYAAVVAGGHHGTFHDLMAVNRFLPKELMTSCSGRWGEQQQAHKDAVFDALGLDARGDEGRLTGPRAAAALVCMAGLVVLADWLASEDACVGAGVDRLAATGGTVGLAAAPAGWVQARASWLAQRLPQTLGVYTDMADPLTAILAEHAGTPSALQRAAQHTVGGLLLATYPTGDGKTEAALLRHAAEKGEGLLFALPTRSTASAMMGRVRAAYAATPNAARLAHGFAALDPFYAAPPTTIDSDGCSAHTDDLHGDDRARGLHPQAWLNGA
ncbi:MAG: CRISPR-associated endonuclease Cas3'', partial [Cellulomonadaceae bacterium]|nr:CRISPR-associated endonuclease Cas3'' [Cellulomonadaceae bacterium]